MQKSIHRGSVGKMGASWSERFMADARMLATSVNARRVLPMLQRSLAVVDRLNDCNPHHHEWRRIAIVAQMLVCTVNEEVEDANVYAAMLRLRRFLDENDDLLDFTTLASA